MNRPRLVLLPLGLAAACLLLLIPLVALFGTSFIGKPTEGGPVASPSAPFSSSSAKPDSVAIGDCPPKRWYETPVAGGIAGAAVGFLLSTGILLLNRRYDRARDDSIRKDERRHNKETREFDFRQSSTEVLVRYEIDKYERKMAELQNNLHECQLTFNSVAALRDLGEWIGLIATPEGSALQALQIFPLAFVDGGLSRRLRRLQVDILAYSAIPPKSESRRQEAFSRIQVLAGSLHGDVEAEFKYAMRQIQLKGREGRNELNNEMARILRSVDDA